MKCLVVDDSATMRRILINALKTIGYNDAVEAADGREALPRCDPSIEMVITDWNMPNMGGLKLVKHLRSDPKTARIPILW
jgi:two-component system, chemotaxis family, chemotaxis protein CheY